MKSYIIKALILLSFVGLGFLGHKLQVRKSNQTRQAYTHCINHLLKDDLKCSFWAAFSQVEVKND